MESKNMIGGIVSLAVVVICVAAIMMPVLSDATETTATLENDGYFHLTKYDTSTDVTIEWDHSDPNVITVNDVDYTLSTPANQFISVAIGDNWYMRYADGGVNVYVQASYGSTSNIPASTTAGTDLEVVCSEGTATITQYASGVAGSSQTVSYTELYAISGDTGDYVMKKSTDSVYMAGDSGFVALGTTTTGDYTNIIRIDGTIDDGATIVVAATSASAATVSDETVNATELDDYVGYSLSTITFTLTVDETDYSATYSYFIVPAEVTLELPEHLGSAEIALLNAIPVLIIVSLVIAALGIAITSRRD